MPVTTKHADFLDREGEWAMMRDAARGSSAVTTAGDRYLPIPSGFRSQPDGGTLMYRAYQTRAQFPEIVEATITGMTGLIHHREPKIDIPPAMDFIWERATSDDMPLEVLHRRLTREILLVGRAALLTDVPTNGGEPTLAMYSAESIINWRHDRSMIVLSEPLLTPNEADEFDLKSKPQFRVLRLTDGVYSVQLYDETGLSGEQIVPSTVGGNVLDRIPLNIAGPRDLDISPDNPPLIGVGRTAFAIYRLDADYRHQLYWTGQETMVGIGIDESTAIQFVGSGVLIRVPAGADLKYVGPSGTGIAAHRVAIDDERSNAILLGAQLLESSKRQAESGEALSIRMSSKNASLKTVALSSAACLEQALRAVAAFLGLDPETVTVTPDLRFVDTEMTSKSATELMQLWIGEAISYETLYENLQRGGIASEERDAEEEKVIIEQEVGDTLPVDPVAPN